MEQMNKVIDWTHELAVNGLAGRRARVVSTDQTEDGSPLYWVDIEGFDVGPTPVYPSQLQPLGTQAKR